MAEGSRKKKKKQTTKKQRRRVHPTGPWGLSGKRESRQNTKDYEGKGRDFHCKDHPPKKGKGWESRDRVD